MCAPRDYAIARDEENQIYYQDTGCCVTAIVINILVHQ
jgi:hypothetical protein